MIGLINKNELERIWKDGGHDTIYLISRNILRGTEEVHEKHLSG
jgi:hypothetical protein